MNAHVGSPGERRTVIAGVSLICVLLVARGAQAVHAWSVESRTAAAELHAEVLAAEDAVRMKTVVEDSLRVRGQRLVSLAPLFLSSDGAGALGAVVSGSAAAAGMELVRMEIGTDPEAGRPGELFARARVRAELRGDVRGLLTFLAALEQTPPLLSTARLTISNSDPSGTRGDLLRITIEVVAVMTDTAGAGE